MFDFESVEQEDLTQGPTRASAEGRENLLDHRWVWMALLLFIVGALVRNASMMAITGFMLVVVFFAWQWNRHALDSLRYWRRFHHRRAFPGERLDVQIVAENAKWLPTTWLQIEDEWPTEFGPANETILAPSAGPSLGYLVNVYALRWHERVRRRYTLLARQRGLFTVGPAHMVSGDPFGLFEDDGSFEKSELLIVYPTIKPLEELGLDAKDPFGEVRAHQRLFEDPNRIMGVRDYRNDDSFRHIHWQATARVGSPQVRQYEPTRTRSVMLCINISSFEEDTRGVWPEMVEYAISVAASLASWSIEQGYSVGLIANAALAQTDRPLRTQPGRSPDQLANLLEAMAGITYFITTDFARFLLQESSRVSWGATLLVISAYSDEQMLATLLRLRQSGRRIVLIVLGKTPAPPLPGILTYHLPFAEPKPKVKSLRVPPDVPDAPESPDTSEGGETPRERYLRERDLHQKASQESLP